MRGKVKMSRLLNLLRYNSNHEARHRRPTYNRPAAGVELPSCNVIEVDFGQSDLIGAGDPGKFTTS